MPSSFDVVPGWAYKWCWYFFFASVISAITAILTLITIITLFNELNKKNAIPLLSVYIFALSLQSVTSMVTFWMCRSSLKPTCA
jgi:hypothetical protein